MSRIGNKPISIPEGVTVQKSGRALTVTGPKGNLKVDIDPNILVEVDKDKVTVKRKNEQKRVKAIHGLVRSLIANMIIGVTEGWSKTLLLVGVGFRAQSNGNKLTLNVGFSHPVEVIAPEGINFEVIDNTKIKVWGIDKELVGQVSSNLKKVRLPDVYKGKGVRYEGEYIRKKVGKSAKLGAVEGKT